jgi:hypothetical protein
MKSFFFKEMFKKPDYFRDTIQQLKELHNEHLSDQVIHSLSLQEWNDYGRTSLSSLAFWKSVMKKDFRQGYFIRSLEIV